jgi:hypothetical protein
MTTSEPPSPALLQQWWCGLRPQQRAQVRAARASQWLPDDVVALLDGSGTGPVVFGRPEEPFARMLSPWVVDLLEEESWFDLSVDDANPGAFETYA